VVEWPDDAATNHYPSDGKAFLDLAAALLAYHENERVSTPVDFIESIPNAAKAMGRPSTVV
jgi:hypothetical protein